MISINKQGNAIVIEFTDNDKYLFNGKIEVAPNELIVVTDDSEMATFKKASNGDVLFSQLISDIQIAGSPVTKDTIIDQFATIGFISGGGEGAVSSVNGQTGDVVITPASLNVYNKTEVESALEEKQEVFQVNSPMAFSRDTATQDLHLSIDLSGYATKEELADKQDKLVSGTNIKTINGNSILGEGNIEISGGGGASNKTWHFIGATEFLTGSSVNAGLSVLGGTVSYGQVSVGDTVILDDYDFVVLNKYTDSYGKHIAIMPIYNAITNDSTVLGYVMDLQDTASADVQINKATMTTPVTFTARADKNISVDTSVNGVISLSGFTGYNKAKPGDVVHITYSTYNWNLVVIGKITDTTGTSLILSGLGDKYTGYNIVSGNLMYSYVSFDKNMDSSIAIGRGAVADGATKYEVAIGVGATTNGTDAVAIGAYGASAATYGTAIGGGASANKNGATVIGARLSANTYEEGKNNLVVIGYGDVDKATGVEVFTHSADGITSIREGGVLKQVAVKDDVPTTKEKTSWNNTATKVATMPNFVTLTQSEYEALKTKDANTIYLIKEA